MYIGSIREGMRHHARSCFDGAGYTKESLRPKRITSVETIDATESARFGGPEFGSCAHKKLFKGDRIIAISFEAHGLALCHSFKVPSFCF